MPRPRPIAAIRAWALGLAVALALVPLTMLRPRHSGNVWARYMAIESVVERGTFAIEDSPLLEMSGSPDKVKVGNHFYSDKPPVLSAIGAAVYAPLVWSGVRFSGSPTQFVLANLVMAVAIVGLATAAALAALRLMLQTLNLPRWRSDLLTLACGFGTLLLTYGVTFNNHSVGAALLTWTLALILLEDPARGRLVPRRVLCGVLAGLCLTIDPPAGGAVLGASALWLALRTRRPPLAFLAGASVPIAIHAVLQMAQTGSPLPVEMTPQLFEYEGSYWTTEAGQFRETIPRWRWGLEFVLGPQGWLTVTPVLGLGLVGLALVLRRRNDPLRALASAVAGVVALLLLYYTWGVRRTDFAGQSFGTRHLVAIAPAVFYFAAVALDRLKAGWAGLLFALLWGIGAVYAWEGMLDPWSRVERRPDVALRVLQRGVLYPWSSYSR